MRSDASSTRPRLSLLLGGGSLEPGAGAPGTPNAAALEPAALADDDDLLASLAGDIAELLAAAPDTDATQAPLALPLGLSACMVRHCVDPEGLIEAMLPLRRALIAVSALDAASEPVPLTAGEPEDAALHLAAYLHGLLARASAASDVQRHALASAAAEQLRTA